jgi:hypothetical protein
VRGNWAGGGGCFGGLGGVGGHSWGGGAACTYHPAPKEVGCYILSLESWEGGRPHDFKDGEGGEQAGEGQQRPQAEPAALKEAGR